jgi:SulP family sulfate permease
MPLTDGRYHHLGTFDRGAFFGEMAFLQETSVRSANALADSDVSLFMLSRQVFDALADEHKKLALNLLEGIAIVLANRLRYTNAELGHLEE